MIGRRVERAAQGVVPALRGFSLGALISRLVQGVSMAKPPGRCIFCGSGGLTKEHVFADWLRDLFPRDETTTHDFGRYEWPKGIITNEPKAAIRQLQGHVGSRKLRVVCKACNTGWMSALEQRAKPILAPLIVGEVSHVSPLMQNIVATWATKTMMIAERLAPRKPGISQEERTWLMNE